MISRLPTLLLTIYLLTFCLLMDFLLPTLLLPFLLRKTRRLAQSSLRG